MSSIAKDALGKSVLDWVKRCAVRFASLYLLLYIVFDDDMTSLFASYGTLFQHWDDLMLAVWRIVVPWAAEHIFAHPVQVGTWGQDRLFAFIEIAIILIVALIAAVLWTALDRGRRRDAVFNEATRTIVRYVLALMIFSYGFSKILPVQFPFPDPFTLMQPVGNLAPIQLMWTFMGYSRLYSLFAGIAEVTGGSLLLFRRTTTLGALILAGVMTNVTLMDAAYDVAVKLIAANFLLMAIFLLLPDAQRLLNAILLYRALPDVSLKRTWSKSSTVLANIVKTLFIIWAVSSNIAISAENLNGMTLAKKQPMTGFYQVQDFKWDNNRGRAPNQGGSTWQRVTIETIYFPLRARINFFHVFDALTSDGRVQRYPLEIERIDQTHGLFKLTHLPNERDGDVASYALSGGHGNVKSAILRYTVVPDTARDAMVGTKGSLELDGLVDGAQVSMRLAPLSTSTFVLVHSKVPIVEPDNFVWSIW